MNKVKFLTLGLVALAFAMVINSCASIVKGSKQDVSVDSSPQKANVIIKSTSGIEFFNGTTPATMKLPKKNEYVVNVSLDGYQETKIPITQSFETWAIGNIFCGGIIGLAIDYANGAMWKLEPNHINVSLMTAYLEDSDDYQLFAVFNALDDYGQLRTLAVPILKNETSEFLSVK